MKVAVVVVVLLSVAFAAVVKRQAPQVLPPPPPPPPSPQGPPPAERNTGGYSLPSGAELIIGSITGGFTCDAKIYGYYADQANNCQIFHVCVPSTLEDDTSPPLLYSFFCGNQTVFDQSNLVCTNPDDAIPCEQAQDFYSVNENFGKTDSPPQRPQQPVQTAA